MHMEERERESERERATQEEKEEEESDYVKATEKGRRLDANRNGQLRRRLCLNLVGRCRIPHF